jgi:hypothetical protein
MLCNRPPTQDLLPWPSLACGYVFLFHTQAITLERQKVINKAGGLIYQRNFAGSLRVAFTLTLLFPLAESQSPFLVDGLAQLTSNEYLVLAGTLHGIHAITSRLSPAGTSSGAQVIEAETFKMTVLLTATGVCSRIICVVWDLF